MAIGETLTFAVGDSMRCHPSCVFGFGGGEKIDMVLYVVEDGKSSVGSNTSLKQCKRCLYLLEWFQCNSGGIWVG